IAILANWVQDALTDHLSLIMMIIIIMSATLTLIAKIAGDKSFNNTPFFKSLFHVNWFWTIVRIVAAIFAVMVYFELGPIHIHRDRKSTRLNSSHVSIS